MTLFTQEQRAALIANGLASTLDEDTDHWPVIKLFTPDASATWLLNEIDETAGIAFGLCDLGMGFPELGYVTLLELETVRGPLGLPIESDAAFKADRPISAYAKAARLAGRIVT